MREGSILGVQTVEVGHRLKSQSQGRGVTEYLLMGKVWCASRGGGLRVQGPGYKFVHYNSELKVA
jgi:hypothetical protein